MFILDLFTKLLVLMVLYFGFTRALPLMAADIKGWVKELFPEIKRVRRKKVIHTRSQVAADHGRIRKRVNYSVP